jgi:phenylalanyl-tRNA synthetase beta chain
MIISQERRIDEIEQEIFATSPKYLEEVELFDIFEGDGLPKGKKSLAFHLIFRAPDRTLTSEEVEKEVAKIRKALENLGAQIR